MKIFASGMLKFLGTYLLVGSDKNNQPQHLAVPGLTCHHGLLPCGFSLIRDLRQGRWWWLLKV